MSSFEDKVYQTSAASTSNATRSPQDKVVSFLHRKALIPYVHCCLCNKTETAAARGIGAAVKNVNFHLKTADFAIRLPN